MKSHRYNWLTYACVSVALVGLPMFGSTAIADPILPGFDYFITPPGGATVDIGSGPIALEGVPLPKMTLGSDTVVARKDPGPPEGASLPLIDIELVALHLKSVAPVDFDPTPGVLLGDLHITIDASDRFWTGSSPRPDGSGLGPSFFDLPVIPLPPSVGNMEITHPAGPHTGAGMRACFGDPAACAGLPSGPGLGVPGGGIFATAIAVVPGGDPAIPADVLSIMPAPPATLGSLGTYAHTGLNPTEYGGIILISIAHFGPHPGAQPLPDNAAPEPASSLLLLCGILGYGFAGCGRRRKV